MIIKMKKYSFLVYHKNYTDFLNAIREIGVLHVIEKKEGIAENDALREKMMISSRIKSALKLLAKNKPKDSTFAEASVTEPDIQVLYDVEEAFNLQESLYQKLQQTEKDYERMEVWGSFSHERLNELKNSGYVLHFFSCNNKKFNPEWEIKYNAFEIDTVGSTMYFITVTHEDEVLEIDADPVKLSKKTAPELLNNIKEIQQTIELHKKKIQEIAVSQYNNLRLLQDSFEQNISFTKVVLNTSIAVDNKVMLLEGWCPEESTEELNTYLEKENVFYQVADPVEGEKVPVKLKNNKFAKLFEMIGELYDLPNYYEIDLTPFFAPFYMLFFGLCLGDTGYGLLLLLLAIFVRRKVNNALKPVFSLLIWLGSSTVIMGFVSGTFFGYNLLESKIQWLESFKSFMLNSEQLFYTSLLLGVIQIIFGMIIKAVGLVRRYGWAASLSTWGWIIAIVGAGGTYVLTTYAHLDPALARWGYYIFGGGGALLIYLLNNIKRNPLINVGAGLWDTYNMATGVLGDVLSYIRLFALGISGAVMGFVFNNLAFQMSGNIPVLSQIIMILILLFGHGINIFMSSLSAFVHPMRLTFVEFYKNSGFEGGGKKYRPFSKFKEEKSIF